MDPTARILRLLSLLQTYRHWGGEELSDRLGVSPRTVRRDVDRLRELGYPVDTTRGTGGGYQLSARTRIPPLLLDDEEAVAIAVGLRTAAGGGVTGIEETSLRALAKLQQVLPPTLRRRVDALADATETTVFTSRQQPTVPADILVAVAQACRGQEQLRFGYEAADGTETSRLVEPHRLVARGRRWYLVAWDLQRDAWRTFRVDRLSRPFANGVRFTPRELPAEDAAAYVTQALGNVPRGNEALLAIPLPLAEAQDQVPRWIGELTADGDRTLLRATNDSPEWLALTLTMIPVEATLVDASPEVRAQLATLRTKVDRLAA